MRPHLDNIYNYISNMAEGGNAVDSDRKNNCNICEDLGLSVRADQYCVSCEQYLCEGCKQYHSRVKATKLHQVIPITDGIPSLISLTLSSESTETSVCKEHGQKLEHFCVSHMTELCEACRLTNHKKCEKSVPIKSAAHDMFSESHSEKILKSLKEMINGLSRCKILAQSNKGNLHQNKQSAIDSVKQVRKTIDNHLEKIEAVAYKEIDRVFLAEMKRIDEQLYVCDVSISQLQKRISKLEIAMTLGDEESEFISVNNITREIKRQCDLLKDIIEETSDVSISFILSDSICNINELISSLGKVSVSQATDSKADSVPVAIYTGEIKVRTKTDITVPEISSYEVLPDERQLLADKWNSKLKVYDSNNQFLSELVLPGHPFCIALLNGTEAIVSLPNIDSLQCVDIGKVPVLLGTKKVHYKPFALLKYGKYLVATVLHCFDWSVELIDQNGNIKRTLYRENDDLDVFGAPYHIAISSDQRTVYISDMDTGCIGLSLDGNIIFQYESRNATVYTGLALSRKSLFIGIDHGKGFAVRRLSVSGDDIADLDLNYSSPLNIKDKSLIIQNNDHKGERMVNIFYLIE